MIKNKPRIAFCFSGQARTLDQTYLFFKKNLFDAAKQQGFDYDVFCVVEDDEDASKVNLLNPTKVKKIKSSDVEQEIVFKIVDHKNFKYLDCDYTKFLPWSVQQQWYKIEESFIIKDDYKKAKNINYDMVFRLRFDVYFLNKINFNNIKVLVSNKLNIVCNKYEKIPNVFRSICDYYFICSDYVSTQLTTMFKKYGNLSKKLISLKFLFVTIASKLILLVLKLDYYRHFLSEKVLLGLKKKYMYGSFVPEIILYKLFLSINAKVLKSSIKILLLRKDGSVIHNGKGFTKFEC